MEEPTKKRKHSENTQVAAPPGSGMPESVYPQPAKRPHLEPLVAGQDVRVTRNSGEESRPARTVDDIIADMYKLEFPADVKLRSVICERLRLEKQFYLLPEELAVIHDEMSDYMRELEEVHRREAEEVHRFVNAARGFFTALSGDKDDDDQGAGESNTPRPGGPSRAPTPLGTVQAVSGAALDGSPVLGLPDQKVTRTLDQPTDPRTDKPL
ncbi:hypothetical protein F4819DRAFT_487787 [Hypoxylon fuscum]|nr:hypothetical protein F4819DRAFT_487787 [Hypoxylon fuscum]